MSDSIELGGFDRGVDVAFVFSADRRIGSFANIGAVNRHAGDDRANRLVQFVAGVIAMTRMALANLDEKRSQSVEVAAQNSRITRSFFSSTICAKSVGSPVNSL